MERMDAGGRPIRLLQTEQVVRLQEIISERDNTIDNIGFSIEGLNVAIHIEFQDINQLKRYEIIKKSK